MTPQFKKGQRVSIVPGAFTHTDKPVPATIVRVLHGEQDEWTGTPLYLVKVHDRWATFTSLEIAESQLTGRR